jgi:hypothetical protein
MSTIRTGYNPVTHMNRTQEVQGKVLERAQELQKKQFDGTIGQDQKLRDVMDAQQKWDQSNLLQQFNPMSWFGGPKESRTLQDLQQRAWADPEVAMQLQHNALALQSLATADRVGVPLEQVRTYLEHIAATALLQGDNQTAAQYSHAIAGLESAAAIIPGYDQAMRSVPSHKREGAPTPPRTAEKTKAAARSAKAAGGSAANKAAKTAAPDALAGVLHPSGVLKGASYGTTELGHPRLKFATGATLTFPPGGLPTLDGKPLSADDAKRVAGGISAWARDPTGVVSEDLLKFADRTLSASTSDAGRAQLHALPSALVDGRASANKLGLPQAGIPNPFAAELSFPAAELTSSPAAAASGTLLLDPLAGSVKMRTKDGEEHPIEDPDRLRMYQLLRGQQRPVEGVDALLRMFEATLLAGR